MDQENDDSLSVEFRLRVYPAMQQEIEEIMAEFPDRWSSEAHFFRAAAQLLLRQLKRESQRPFFPPEDKEKSPSGGVT